MAKALREVRSEGFAELEELSGGDLLPFIFYRGSGEKGKRSGVKFESRISNLEGNTKFEEGRNLKRQWNGFRYFGVRASDLFRISGFEIRILNRTGSCKSCSSCLGTPWWNEVEMETLGNRYDNGFVLVGHDALQPNVVIEEAVLKEQAIKVFRWCCAVNDRTKSYAVAPMPIGPCGLEIPASPFMEIDSVFPATSEGWRQSPWAT